MSRIGNKPIDFPKGVTMTVQDGVVSGKGPAGELTFKIPPGITVDIEGSRVRVGVAGEHGTSALHGATRTVLANMVEGLQKPFVKDLEIQGVGFKAQLQGQNLILSLGFSHPIDFEVPKGIKVQVAESTGISVSGPDKQLVGQVASVIRGYFPAEPYKGKGVRYKGEHVRRKAGKAVA